MTARRRRSPSSLLCVAAAAVALMAAGCGGTGDDAASPLAASTAASTAASSLAPDSSGEPVGLIAIGHSGLTGESSDPARLGAEAKENSWVTGTAAAVNSVYLRMVKLRPETEGAVANTAKGGAKAFALSGQAAQALKLVPQPALVVVNTIDNDIRCDGNDARNVGTFGRQVADALSIIRKASPRSQILVVGQLGRPVTTAVALGGNAGFVAQLSGSGPCDFFDPAGNVIPSKLEFLTGVIEGYEAEQARVCAAVPPCSTDEGVLAGFIEDPAEIAGGHLLASALARVAELMWPTVEKLLR